MNIHWLHSQGYTFFTIPKLTYPEINTLIQGHNWDVKQQEVAQKKAERKAKTKKR